MYWFILVLFLALCIEGLLFGLYLIDISYKEWSTLYRLVKFSAGIILAVICSLGMLGSLIEFMHMVFEHGFLITLLRLK